MHNEGWNQLFTLLVIAVVIYLIYRRPPWRRDAAAHGSAAWESENAMRRTGMFSGTGLILGRTPSGRLITLPSFCHVLLCGGTGSGKGVSIIIPALLWWFQGSSICFDTKGDLFATTAKQRRRRGQRIIDLAPFGGGKDKRNPLDAIRAGPKLVDHARAIAEALVVRQGTEPDQHWNESAVIVICAILVFVLAATENADRNLNTVREIAADPALLDACADKLVAMNGIPARLGHHIQGLQDKEKSGVLSTVGRHLAFLDSELVAAAVASSTFDVASLCQPGTGTTLYLRIPPDQLEAQRGLLRCWITTLIRTIGQLGMESVPVLCVIDEASALGSLPALEEALVRGRSAGARLLLGYQSESQIRAAFPHKPTLIQDNCDTTIYLCPPNSYETADLIAKRLGVTTIEVETFNDNSSTSWQTAGAGESGQSNWGWSRNYAQAARPLMTADEVSTMSGNELIAFVRGLNPIRAFRVKWYADPAFGTAFWLPPPLWWLLLMACVALMWWALQVARHP